MTEWRDPAIYCRCAAAMKSDDVAEALEVYVEARERLRHAEALHHTASREVKSAREAAQNAKEDLLDTILAEERAVRRERDTEHQKERREFYEMLWHILEAAGGEVRIPKSALVAWPRDKFIERDEDFATDAVIYRSVTGPLPTPEAVGLREFTEGGPADE